MSYEQVVRTLAGLVTPEQAVDSFMQFMGHSPDGPNRFEEGERRFSGTRIERVVRAARPENEVLGGIFDQALNTLRPLLSRVATGEGREALISQYADDFFAVHSPASIAAAAMEGFRQNRYHGGQIGELAEVAVRHNQPELMQALFAEGYTPGTHTAQQLVAFAIHQNNDAMLAILYEEIGWHEISSWERIGFNYDRNAQGNATRRAEFDQDTIRARIARAANIPEGDLTASAVAVVNVRQSSDIAAAHRAGRPYEESDHNARIRELEAAWGGLAAAGIIRTPTLEDLGGVGPTDLTGRTVFTQDGFFDNIELTALARTIGATLEDVKEMSLTTLNQRVEASLTRAGPVRP